jgi:hypothetical protein
VLPGLKQLNGCRLAACYTHIISLFLITMMRQQGCLHAVHAVFMSYLCKALGALVGELVTHDSVARHSQAVEEAAVEEVEEFEAIEKLETLGVNRGQHSYTCMHCKLIRAVTPACWPCTPSCKHRSLPAAKCSWHASNFAMC